MDYSFYIELFGYLGSTMVVVSMLMPSVVKLRVINTIGSVISGTYALIIGSVPLALMNISLVLINLYNLRKLLMTEQQYDLILSSGQDAYISYFLNRYREDIRHFYPEFSGLDGELDRVYLVFCNGDTAGILLARETVPGTLTIALEYSTPAYRDCSIGKYLYSALPGQGISKLVMNNAPEKHMPYLEKMGYRINSGSYVKELN